ncbi:hypothetical protein [Nocardiopsis dassonvillei]|uniref:hypothetical protein n=1 Tax=Nocardiopsis dassonvillei TaxID=2014 RepID=UPI0018DF8C69|nr:hypothetical protein [Nocardiopsis dassonvillei]
MRQFSAAALIRALGMVKALFAPPCGRHSATGGRRRRSTRVRRYVPVPAQVRAPVEATAPPARTDRAPERPERPKHPKRPAAPGSVPAAAPAPATAPRLAPPSVRFPAEDIALVRPYYAAREQARAEARAGTREPGAARVRREITIRLDQRPGTNTPFSGDLLATDSGPVPTPAPVRVPAPALTRVPAQTFEPGPPPAPAPRPPSPACEDPEDWRAFARLARVWLDQQQRAERTQRAQQVSQPRAEHHRQAVPA